MALGSVAVGLLLCRSELAQGRDDAFHEVQGPIALYPVIGVRAEMLLPQGQDRETKGDGQAEGTEDLGRHSWPPGRVREREARHGGA